MPVETAITDTIALSLPIWLAIEEVFRSQILWHQSLDDQRPESHRLRGERR